MSKMHITSQKDGQRAESCQLTSFKVEKALNGSKERRSKGFDVQMSQLEGFNVQINSIFYFFARILLRGAANYLKIDRDPTQFY